MDQNLKCEVLDSHDNQATTIVGWISKNHVADVISNDDWFGISLKRCHKWLENLHGEFSSKMCFSSKRCFGIARCSSAPYYGKGFYPIGSMYGIFTY